MTREHPDDLVAALRRLADEHEPDAARIWARVDPAGERAAADAERVVPVSLDARRDRAVRTPRTVRPGRRLLAVPLAAAAVLGVLVAGRVLARPDGAAAPATTSSAVVAPPTTTTRVPATPTTPATLGSAVATSTTPSPSSSSTPAPDASSTPPRPTGPAPSTASGLGVPEPVVGPLDGPARTLFFSTPALDDWVVVGARADLRAEQAKRPALPTDLAVAPPARSVLAASPLSVGWSDGLPEQDRSGVTTWLAGPPGAAWTITTQRLDVPRRLVVVGGGAASGLRLTVTGPGRSGQWTWAPNPAGPGPFTVAVFLPGGVGPVTVTLAPTAGEALSVAAVSTTRA